MLVFHPQILKKDGKKLFVVLPYEEFVAIQNRLDDAEDLLELRKAQRRQSGSPTTPLADVKRRYGIKK